MLDDSIKLLLQSKTELKPEIKKKRAADINALLASTGWKWVNAYIERKIDYMSDIRNVKDDESHKMVTTIRKRQTIMSTLAEFRFVLNNWVKQAEKSEQFRTKGV